LPVGNHAFMKLGIKEYYSLQGKSKKPTITGNRVDAGWAIVSNSKLLGGYFSWLEPIFVEIARVYGRDIFHASTDHQKQQAALDYITESAFAHQWCYVMPDQSHADTVLLGTSGNVAFSAALYNELTGRVRQHPANLVISTNANPQFAVLIDHLGHRQVRQSLDELLRGHAFGRRASMSAVIVSFADWIADVSTKSGGIIRGLPYPPKVSQDVGIWIAYVENDMGRVLPRNLQPFFKTLVDDFNTDPDGFSKIVIDRIAARPAPTPTPAPAAPAVATPDNTGPASARPGTTTTTNHSCRRHSGCGTGKHKSGSGWTDSGRTENLQ
jgi:hypothetical protein